MLSVPDTFAAFSDCVDGIAGHVPIGAACTPREDILREYGCALDRCSDTADDEELDPLRADDANAMAQACVKQFGPGRVGDLLLVTASGTRQRVGLLDGSRQRQESLHQSVQRTLTVEQRSKLCCRELRSSIRLL